MRHLRVLVCGGRDYGDMVRVTAVLDEIHEKRGIRLIIHGRAAGADTLGGIWGTRNKLPVMTFEPQWDAFGNSAGPIRNGWMLEFGDPDLVVAFPGAGGTSNMVRQSKEAGVEVVLVAA